MKRKAADSDDSQDASDRLLKHRIIDSNRRKRESDALALLKESISIIANEKVESLSKREVLVKAHDLIVNLYDTNNALRRQLESVVVGAQFPPSPSQMLVEKAVVPTAPDSIPNSPFIQDSRGISDPNILPHNDQHQINIQSTIDQQLASQMQALTRNPVPNAQNPVSNIQSLASNVQSQTSNLRSPVANAHSIIQSNVSNLQSPIPVQSHVSNLQTPVNSLSISAPMHYEVPSVSSNQKILIERKFNNNNLNPLSHTTPSYPPNSLVNPTLSRVNQNHSHLHHCFNTPHLLEELQGSSSQIVRNTLLSSPSSSSSTISSPASSSASMMNNTLLSSIMSPSSSSSSLNSVIQNAHLTQHHPNNHNSSHSSSVKASSSSPPPPPPVASRMLLLSSLLACDPSSSSSTK